jgi:putative membrane protein
MSYAADIVVALVALLHVYFLVLEMFLWTRAFGRKVFGLTPEFAQYNGFLAAGLFWGLTLGQDGTGVKVFFLACVLVAGLYGAATASRKILFVQGVPGALGLILLALS